MIIPKKCKLWFHNWSEWKLLHSRSGRVGRICYRCGKIQVKHTNRRKSRE